jgi:hypothetical protein
VFNLEIGWLARGGGRAAGVPPSIILFSFSQSRSLWNAGLAEGYKRRREHH